MFPPFQWMQRTFHFDKKIEVALVLRVKAIGKRGTKDIEALDSLPATDFRQAILNFFNLYDPW